MIKIIASLEAAARVARGGSHGPHRDAEYVGCFQDTGLRVLEVRVMDKGTTPEVCHTACSGYKFFGVQDGKTCWCGNGPNLGEPLPEAECNSPCKAQPHSICGGRWRNSIYRVAPPAHRQEADVETVMFISDKESKQPVLAMEERTGDGHVSQPPASRLRVREHEVGLPVVLFAAASGAGALMVLSVFVGRFA